MDATLAPRPQVAGETTLAGGFPHRRIRIGLVGLNFGRYILDEIVSRPHLFDLTAICDQDKGRLAEARRNLDVAYHESLDDLLADARVEAVGLFTGPAGRADLMRRVLESGRHVLTTKPLELDPNQALAALKDARRRRLVVHCNSPSPLPPGELNIIESWCQEHDLGRPVGARADVWVSYRERADGSWYDDVRSCPAAPVFRLGIYLINDLVRLWGRVERVQVMGSRLFTQRPTSDNAQVGLEFANGAIANIFASFCVQDGDSYRNTMVLNYERGTIYRNAGPAWTSGPDFRSRLALVQLRDGIKTVVAEGFPPVQSWEYQWEVFARAVRGDRIGPELSPDQMVEGIRIMKAIAEAEHGHGTANVTR